MKNFKKRIFIISVCGKVKVSPMCSIMNKYKLKSNYREFHELLLIIDTCILIITINLKYKWKLFLSEEYIFVHVWTCHCCMSFTGSTKCMIPSRKQKHICKNSNVRICRDINTDVYVYMYIYLYVCV